MKRDRTYRVLGMLASANPPKSLIELHVRSGISIASLQAILDEIGIAFLEDHPVAPVSPTQASQQAHESIQPHKSKLCSAILHQLKQSADHGMTCDEIEVALNFKHQTASARVNELMNSGYIQPSGKYRNTRSGRKAIVWVLTTWAKDGQQQVLIP